MQETRPETTYERWIREQGLSIVGGFGVEDVFSLPLAPWKRLGGKGTFVKLEGMEGISGMFLAEMPADGSLNPEKHIYEELIYVLKGSGTVEIWTKGSDKKTMLEWQTGSLFAVPLNSFHQFHNGSGAEPALLVGFTNAPLVLDVFHDPVFVFGVDYTFLNRFDGRADYFKGDGQRFLYERERIWLWETNFVPDVRQAQLDSEEKKGAGTQLTQIQMADGILVGHIAEWPVGRYHKAHHHSAGAVILILRSVGFTLLWPREAGIRPFESGNADKVVRIDWREGSAFSPPQGWFHQHFNTGPGQARQLALRYGTRKYSVEFRDRHSKGGVYKSTREGGTVIEYEDEDPEIRRIFAEECAKHGAEVRMPVFGGRG